MRLDYTPQQKALRRELRAYFEKLITPEVKARLRALEGGTLHRQIVAMLGLGMPRAPR